MKIRIFWLTLFMLVVMILPNSTIGQEYLDFPPKHGNEYGAGITLAMSGFGLGGFYRMSLPGYFHAGASLDFYMMRDDNEFTYYDYWGIPRQINKFNRLFLVPLSVELKKRIFENSIEDDFRPYLVGIGGLTFGMNFPQYNPQFAYLTPEEQARLPRDNEYRLSLNLGVGFGIDITTSENYFFSIRPQYRIIYFPKNIAGKSNHSTFEIRLEIGKRTINALSLQVPQ